MADTQQQAPQQQPAGLQPIPALGGSVTEAQEALLSLLDPEEETQETGEEQPTKEESTEETQDESLEEEQPDEEEEEGEEPDEDEETDEVEETEESDEVTLYTVKVELAEDRRNAEAAQAQYQAEISALQQERQQYAEALSQVIQSSMAGLDQYSNIDWETLKTDDPIEYITKRDEYEHGKLVAAVPEWGEPAGQKKLATDLRAYAINQGYSTEEIGGLVDHRSLIVLMKAQKYDALQKADVKSKKVKNKPKVVRAGTGAKKSQEAKSQRKAQMKRLQGSGHLDDASALLEDFIDI